MKLIALLVLLAVVGYSSAALPVVPCSSKATDLGVTSIRIMTTPECEAFPCSVKRGTNVTIMIEFKDNAGDTINDLLNKVYGIIAGIPVPFPGFPDSAADVCTLAADGTSKCPIKVGDSFTEKVTLPVISSAPAISVTAKWELNNKDTGNMEGCFLAQLKLT